MAEELKGTYADRPLTPETKRALRKAQAAAVHSLREVYAVLIEFVIDHNNRTHEALKKIRRLKQAGVKPTPQAAFFWGLKNITGLRNQSLSDEEICLRLLSVRKANIANGVVNYKGQVYKPANELAFAMAAESTGRPKQVDVRVDLSVTGPNEVWIPNRQGTRALFEVTPGGARDMAGVTIQEDELLTPGAKTLADVVDHDARRLRVVRKSEAPRRASKRSGGLPQKLPREELNEARKEESSDFKQSLLGKPIEPRNRPGATPSQTVPEWEKLAAENRRRSLEKIKKNRPENDE
jgi:hypothetical protein